MISSCPFGGFAPAACRGFFHSGRTTIPARILELDDILQGEFAENEIRKDFTVSERVAIARAIEDRLAGRHGGDRKTDQGGNFSTLIEPGKSRDLAAEKSGFGSGKTYEAAKKAVEELPASLVDALDDGRINESDEQPQKIQHTYDVGVDHGDGRGNEQLIDTSREAG